MAHSSIFVCAAAPSNYILTLLLNIQMLLSLV